MSWSSGSSSPSHRCPSTSRCWPRSAWSACRAAGRNRLYRLEAPALAPLQRWLATYEQLINARYDRLDDYLAELQAERSRSQHRTNVRTEEGKPVMSNRHGSAVVTLPSDTEILITRQFDAPAALVWEALTRPEHIKRWWGPEWCPITSAEIDLRVGGSWRYVCRMDDGTELGWHGEYREIDPGRSITSTEVFEGFPDAESLNTMTLTESDGVTTLTTLVRHTSQENRDGHVNSGMEGGMQDTFNRLDALLVQFDSERERFRRVAAPIHRRRSTPCRRRRGRTRRRARDGRPATSCAISSSGCPSFFSRAGIELPVSVVGRRRSRQGVGAVARRAAGEARRSGVGRVGDRHRAGRPPHGGAPRSSSS